LKISTPVRILIVVSSPKNFMQLDVHQEVEKIRNALGDLVKRKQIEIDFLQHPTQSNLLQKLRYGNYHILHFVGHGGYDARSQDGVLVLEDDATNGYPVSGDRLGMLLHDEKSLRLVVLNACEGARTSSSDPFAGVAQSLVQQGIPAVIAMQFEITDQAAIVFSQSFYTALAEGVPVDASLTEARKAIFADGNDVEWGTPVLYLRAIDGKIFDID
jgi:CHAT domain-containing protein